MLRFTTLVIVLWTTISPGCCSPLNHTDSKNITDSTKESQLQTKISESKRLGLHTGVVSSDGWNSGGTSSTSVTGVGAQAGVLRGDGSYNPIYNQASQGGQTYQTGNNPPDSYGVVTSQMSPGSVGGSVSGDVNNAYQKNVYTYEVNSGSWQNLPNSNDYLWHGFNLNPSNSTDTKHTNLTKSN